MSLNKTIMKEIKPRRDQLPHIPRGKKMTIRAAFLAIALALSTPHRRRTPSSPPRPSPAAASGAWKKRSRRCPGVVSAVSGYIGGSKKSPTYEEVSTGRTGHTEAVQVKYDPAKVTYEQLLRHFWVNHDPTTIDSQFCDHGSQYKPAIFWHDEQQKRLAEASKAQWRRTSPSRARSSRRS
jgi:methionine-S-sulfoxide reductase